MTSFQNIKSETKNHIAYITIDRPKVLNALNMATMQEIKQAFTDAKQDADVRVVILTGAGEKAFVAGADIGELSQHTPVSAKEYTHQGQAIIDAIENLGKPVIACINGFALGGGCELAMACTMRLASENAKLGQPEVKLGLIPGYGGTQRLPRLVGKGIAMQLVLAGEMITAQEAHRIGLVNEVVPAAELIPRAEAIAAKIIANAPLADSVRHGGGESRTRYDAGRRLVPGSHAVRRLLLHRRQERGHESVSGEAAGGVQGKVISCLLSVCRQHLANPPVACLQKLTWKRRKNVYTGPDRGRASQIRGLSVS